MSDTYTCPSSRRAREDLHVQTTPDGLTASDYHRLACACTRDKTRLSEAVHYSRLALQGAPDNALYYAFLGRDLAQVGRVREAVDMLERAAQMAPDNPEIRASHLWYLSYLAEQSPESISCAYRQWAADFMPARLAWTDHERVLELERRLRIAYVSPDFRRHSVAYCFEPILDGHDRDQIEVFGYGNVAHEDDTTRHLKEKFDCYRGIWGLSDEQLASQIEQDKIDILVALAGHCTNNRLPALACKPAPIQVDLGGITTTGMSQVDYRITDAILDPPASQAFYAEELMYVPSGFVSYRPPAESPLVQPLPAHKHGHITFGSFNNNVKIDVATVRLWARVLRACPEAAFVLKCFAAGDPGIRDYYLALFAGQGIKRDRIQFWGEMSHYEHLEALGKIDIALDTFPFNGCVTTLEGLWMGVPIVTLNGTTYVAQVGRNIMTQLGLETFVALHPDEFVAKACAFATQPAELACIRAALRDLMLDSPLCRPQGLARELESLYREMWRRWVAGKLNRSLPTEKQGRRWGGGLA